jgi:hypothetical protein
MAAQIALFEDGPGSYRFMPSTQWEYFVQGLAREQSLEELRDALAELGRDGWQLVSVLDQSADIGLQHKTDARMMILKRASWKVSVKRQHPEAAAKALDMAARQIDKLADASATNEEREQRKRRLLRGPKEFRAARGVPKSKR